MPLKWLPSGNLLQFANLKMTIEIVDVPIEHGGDFPGRVTPIKSH